MVRLIRKLLLPGDRFDSCHRCLLISPAFLIFKVNGIGREEGKWRERKTWEEREGWYKDSKYTAPKQFSRSQSSYSTLQHGAMMEGS
jgi:hypothetical protein